MQATMEGGRLMFARRHGRDYMMRSEKRPSYGGASGRGRPPSAAGARRGSLRTLDGAGLGAALAGGHGAALAPPAALAGDDQAADVDHHAVHLRGRLWLCADRADGQPDRHARAGFGQRFPRPLGGLRLRGAEFVRVKAVEVYQSAADLGDALGRACMANLADGIDPGVERGERASVSEMFAPDPDREPAASRDPPPPAPAVATAAAERTHAPPRPQPPAMPHGQTPQRSHNCRGRRAHSVHSCRAGRTDAPRRATTRGAPTAAADGHRWSAPAKRLARLPLSVPGATPTRQRDEPSATASCRAIAALPKPLAERRTGRRAEERPTEAPDEPDEAPEPEAPTRPTARPNPKRRRGARRSARRPRRSHRAGSSPTEAPTSPSATAAPAPSPTAGEVLAPKPAGEAVVYYNEGGVNYHMRSSCVGMSSARRARWPTRSNRACAAAATA